MRKSILRTLVSCLAAASVAGCEGIPTHMHVRHGVEPEHADKDVVFRTTYYFRVFDVCDNDTEEALTSGSDSLVFVNKHGRGQKLLKDSLYRFVMTGKANPLFNQITFESGTLKSYEIDPLGATVDFDETNRRFLFKSRGETELDAHRDQAETEIARLLKLRQELASGASPDEALLAAVDAVILEHVRTLSPVGIKGFVGNKPLSETAEKQIAAGDAARAVAVKFKAVVPAPVAQSYKDARSRIEALLAAAKEIKEPAVAYAGWLADLSTKLGAAAPLVDTALAEVDKANKDATKALDAPMTGIESAANDGDGKRTALAGKLAPAIEARNKAHEMLDRIGKSASPISNAVVVAVAARKDLEPAMAEALEAQRRIDTQNRIARNASEDAQADFAKSAATAAALVEAASKPLSAKLVDPAVATADIAAPVEKAKAAKAAFDSAAKALKATAPDFGIAKTELGKAKAAIEAATQAAAKLKDILAVAVIDKAVADYGQASKDFAADEETFGKVTGGAASLASNFDGIADRLGTAGSSNNASAYSLVAQQLADPQKSCDETGGNVRRGFQIMGPEGVKTFDQEDRLIMAMSTSAKPLIGMLKDLSARVLQERAAGADQLLPLARERSAILRAQRSLDQARAASAVTPESIVDATIAGFEQGRGQ